MQVELPEPVVDTKELAKSPKKASIDRNARLFNKNVLAAEAFKWDLKRMLHFLSDAAKNPDHYGVHRDHHHTLTTAVTKLEELSDLSASRAFLTPDEQRLDPMDIDWENVQLKCHSQYEVLGLVLSILGRAPL